MSGRTLSAVPSPRFLGTGSPAARRSWRGGAGQGLIPTDVADALPAALLEPSARESALDLPGIVLDLPPAR